MSYRGHLRSQYKRRTFGGNIDQALNSSSTELPTCTCFLEVDNIPESDDAAEGAGLVFAPYSQHHGALLLNSVVFDHFEKILPENPSLVMFLESDERFHPVPPELLNSSSACGIPAYSFRILPTTNRRQSKFGLQPAIIRRIVDFAIGHKPRGWRGALLNYGLVAKSWHHVLGLYFERFDGSPDDVQTNIHVCARALERNPAFGTLMRTLDYKNYRLDSHPGAPVIRPEFGMDGWRSFLKILECATLVRDVDLAVVPGIMVDELVHGLSRLRQVRKFRHVHKSEVLELDGLSMAQVQTIISNWKHLRSLEIHDWAEDVEWVYLSVFFTCLFC
ncbi:hypothetical protein C0991_008943 [Blastosporella zonata]|nr:hypothetical protein C0991_008943 [Blastosporella zonata]